MYRGISGVIPFQNFFEERFLKQNYQKITKILFLIQNSVEVWICSTSSFVHMIITIERSLLASKKVVRQASSRVTRLIWLGLFQILHESW